MARTISLLEAIFAQNANTVIPGSPVPGTAYRNTAILESVIENGWNYFNPVDGAGFNEILYRIAALLSAVEMEGMLEWSALTNYAVGTYTRGSTDNKIYQALQASGPDEVAGTKDPDAGGNPAYWVDYAADIAAIIPVGSYLDLAMETPPTGYLECDGSAISRTTYSALFAVVADQYGVGDGSTTFNIPDWRGLFPRCWDNGASIDPDAGSISGQSANTNTSTSITNAPNVSVYAARRYVGADITGTDIPANTKIVAWSGTTITISQAATGTSAISDMAIDFDVVESKQANDIESHTHDMSCSPTDTGSPSDRVESTSSSSDLVTIATDTTGGNETRPVNMYQMRCIKY